VVSSTSSVSRAFTKSANTAVQPLSKAAAEANTDADGCSFRVISTFIKTLPNSTYFVVQKQKMSMPFLRKIWRAGGPVQLGPVLVRGDGYGVNHLFTGFWPA
jgi:hypothetical protein